MPEKNVEESRCKKSGCSGHVRPVDPAKSRAAIAAYQAANPGKKPAFICLTCNSLFPEDQYLALVLENVEGRIKPASE